MDFIVADAPPGSAPFPGGHLQISAGCYHHGVVEVIIGEIRLATASLTWLDLTAADHDKVRGVLNLFHEQGTVDELGLGSCGMCFPMRCFPATSVLHTRLRYALFVPWIYQELESRGTGYDIGHHAREMEVQLIDAGHVRRLLERLIRIGSEGE